MAYDFYSGGFDPSQYTDYNRDALLQQLGGSYSYQDPASPAQAQPLSGATQPSISPSPGFQQAIDWYAGGQQGPDPTAGWAKPYDLTGATQPSVAPPSMSQPPQQIQTAKYPTGTTAPTGVDPGFNVGTGTTIPYGAVSPTQPTSSYQQGQTYNPMAGWDTTKLNDPAQGTTIKYDFGRFVQNQGYDPLWARTHLPEIVQAFNQQFGTQAKAIGDDKIDFAQQGWDPIDVLRSDNQWQWLTNVQTPSGQIVTPIGNVVGQTTPSFGGIDPRVGQAGVFQESAGMGGGLPTPQMGGGTEDPTTSALRQYLLQQLQGAGQPVDENSPYIRQTMDAARATADRQQQQERSQLAERLYAQGGLNTNALTQGIQQSNERNALGLAGLQAGLIGNEIAAQRTQVAQALQLANAVGAREEAMALQRELANLDNQYRYAMMNQQGSQFSQSLGQNAYQFGQNLQQRQGEWNDTYGLNRLQIQNEMNRQAMLAALGY